MCCRCGEQQVQHTELHVGLGPDAVPHHLQNPSDHTQLCGFQTRPAHRPAHWRDGHHSSMQTHRPHPQRHGESHTGRTAWLRCVCVRVCDAERGAACVSAGLPFPIRSSLVFENLNLELNANARLSSAQGEEEEDECALELLDC